MCFTESSKFLLFSIFFQSMSLNIQKAATSLIQSDLQQRMTEDKLAGKYLNHKILKVIYDFSLDLSYSLLFASIGMVVVFDTSERQELVDYCGNMSNKIYLITVIILATMIVAFQKLSKIKHFGYKCRKICSFIEDLMRSAVYTLLLIVLTPLALGNWSLSSKILQAYGIYLASGVLFLVMRVVKWVYYLCGSGKDEYDPWMESQTQEKLTDKQKKQIQDLVGKFLNKKPENVITSPHEGESEMIL